MLALGWSPGYTGVQAAILLPTDWLLRAPPPAVLSECPLLEAYCGVWSDACQKGLSLYHEWTPQPLKYSDPKKKPFPFKAPQVLSPQHISLMNSKQFSLSPNLTTSCMFMGDPRAISLLGKVHRPETLRKAMLSSVGDWGWGWKRRCKYQLISFIKTHPFVSFYASPCREMPQLLPGCVTLSFFRSLFLLEAKIRKGWVLQKRGCPHTIWRTIQDSLVFSSGINCFSYSLFSRVSFEYEKVVSDQMLKGFVLRSLDYIF